MISVSKMSAQALASYHTGQSKDELYHTKDAELGIWQGELAAELGLKVGAIIGADEFKKIAHSIDPHREEFLIQEHQIIAAFDLTASVPKSVSIVAELGTKQERVDMIAAHQAGINAVKKLIASDYAGYQTREKDGSRGHKHTGKTLISEWQHGTSRNQDMDLHTHLVVHNLTIDESGKFRSFDARELFKNEYYLGQIYRNVVAAELQNRDYALTVTDREQGFYELSAVGRPMIEHYSSRGAEIEAERTRMRKELGRELTKEEHDMCKTATRNVKQRVDKEELCASWQKSAQQFTLGELKAQGEIAKITTAEEAVDIAANTLFEKEAIVKKEELYRQALKIGLGSGITLDQIDAAAQANDKLIFMEKSRVTTREMSEIETAILRDIDCGRGQFKSILSKEETVLKIEEANKARKEETGYALTQGQSQTAVAILSNADSIMIVQGDAGSGKTTLLTEINKIVQEQGRSIFGAAYTGSSAAEIEAASGIKSQTLHSMLLRKPELPENSIIVVDEASMLGSKQLRELQLYAAESSSQIITIGDSKQIKGISSGDMFTRLQEQPEKVQTAVMSESIRAKTSELKELYQLIKDKQFEQSFAKMASRGEIVEASKADAIKEIVAAYDEHTLVVADLNLDRNALNYAIRDKVGFAGGENIDVSLNLTADGVSRHFSQSYEVGSTVAAEKAIPGMKPGQKAEIISIDQVKNTLTVKTENGADLTLDLYRVGDKIGVSKSVTLPFSVGEKIIFRKNDKKDLNVLNGQIGIIESIDKNRMKIKHEDGKIREVDLAKYNHLDYGYCRTVMASQGQSYSKVFGLLDSRVASSNSYYVTITRAMHKIKIWTNDLEKFQKNAEKMQAKTSTTDHLSALTQQTKQQESNNGRSIIESLRSFARDRTTKFGDLSRNLEDLIEGIRNRGVDAIRYLREYRQSLSRDRESTLAASQSQPTGSASLDRAIHTARSDRGYELSCERTR